MADQARVRKIAERVKVIVAEMLETRIKDERLGFVTITDVRMTGDLQHASVFYTVFGSPQERSDSEAALHAAKGRIRSAVGRGIGLRLTPSVEFIPDALPEGAAHVEGLLAVAKQRDAELAAVAAGASYAGDEDPYRHPSEGAQQLEDLDQPDQLDHDGVSLSVGPDGRGGVALAGSGWVTNGAVVDRSHLSDGPDPDGPDPDGPDDEQWADAAR